MYISGPCAWRMIANMYLGGLQIKEISFLKYVIYLFMTDRERERETERERERERHRQREKQAPCREPHVGLDPRTPGSRPGPKAGTKLLSDPGIPGGTFSLKTPREGPAPWGSPTSLYQPGSVAYEMKSVCQGALA